MQSATGVSGLLNKLTSRYYSVTESQPVKPPIKEPVTLNYSTFKSGEDRSESTLSNVSPNEERTDGGSWSSFIWAISLSVVSGFLFSFCSFLAKKLDAFPTGTLTALVTTFQFVAGIPAAIAFPEGIIRDSRTILSVTLNCLFACVSTYLWLLSMRRLSLFDANVIIVSYPTFAAIFSRLFLKESCSLLQVTSIFLTFGGLCLLTKLPWLLADPSSARTPVDVVGLLIAFSCTMSYVALALMSRYVRRIHFGANQFYVAILSSPILVIVLLADERPRLPECGSEALAFIMLVVLYVVGAYTLTVSLQKGEVGMVSVARSAADVVFTFILQATVLGQVPDVLSIVGGLLVTCSVVLYGLKAFLLSKVESSRRVQKLKCLF